MAKELLSLDYILGSHIILGSLCCSEVVACDLYPILHVEFKPQNPKTPCFLSDMSFVLRYDLIASDVNQCDSLIGKSRIILL